MAGYRDLVFYQKAQAVVKGVDLLVKTWPRSVQTQEISRQLFRSATSIGANIAEGHGRHRGREYIHYVTISQGSANEVDHWLHTALDCNLEGEEGIGRLIELNDEIRKMLNATINTLRERQGSKTVREVPNPYTPNPSPLEEIEL
jgi:four helix bundle protein